MTKNVTTKWNIKWVDSSSYWEAWVYLDNGDRVRLVITGSGMSAKFKLYTSFYCGKPNTAYYYTKEGDYIKAKTIEKAKKLAVDLLNRYNTSIGALARK